MNLDYRMMKMKRARIIYNPTSGREAFKKHLPEGEKYYSEDLFLGVMSFILEVGFFF